MPYIEPLGDRTRIDAAVRQIPAGEWRHVSAGELNYAITRMLTSWLGADSGYGDLNAALGVLECAKLELYRRVVVPYEDKKKEENGDVYES